MPNLITKILTLVLVASTAACSSTSPSRRGPSYGYAPSGRGPQNPGPPSKGGGGGGGARGGSTQGALLEQHNRVRAQVGTRPLVWSDRAASLASSYAARCEWGHNPNNADFGENLFASSGTAGPDEVVSSWAAEQKYYEPSTGRCSGGECGHYTQVVWSKTTAVGCAMESCTKNNPFGRGTWTYWVCNYEPPGNYTNQKAY